MVLIGDLGTKTAGFAWQSTSTVGWSGYSCCCCGWLMSLSFCRSMPSSIVAPTEPMVDAVRTLSNFVKLARAWVGVLWVDV